MPPSARRASNQLDGIQTAKSKRWWTSRRFKILQLDLIIEIETSKSSSMKNTFSNPKVTISGISIKLNTKEEKPPQAGRIPVSFSYKFHTRVYQYELVIDQLKPNNQAQG